MTVYNIVLNSLNKVDGPNTSCYYHFDWSVLPRGEYKVTFTYQGGPNTISYFYITTLSVDLGQSKNFKSSPDMVIAPSTQVIGQLLTYNVRPVETTDTSFLISSPDNIPIYLNSVPPNNKFLVEILDQWGGRFYDDLGIPNGDYVLILSLELINGK